MSPQHNTENELVNERLSSVIHIVWGIWTGRIMDWVSSASMSILVNRPPLVVSFTERLETRRRVVETPFLLLVAETFGMIVLK